MGKGQAGGVSGESAKKALISLQGLRGAFLPLPYGWTMHSLTHSARQFTPSHISEVYSLTHGFCFFMVGNLSTFMMLLSLTDGYCGTSKFRGIGKSSNVLLLKVDDFSF